MIIDKINVRFIDIGNGAVTIGWPIKNLEFAEDLAYDILADKNVGPVYRHLFGLRFVNQPSLWLAPNVKIQELLNSEKHRELTLELRMRFRPSSYTKMIVLDKTAFNFIFAQMRYDFIHTKFTDEKRDFILLNDSVLGLIATDLLRYALEKKINTNEIFERVDSKDFIPHRASKWQRSLLFHLRQKLNLQKTVQIMGYKTLVKDANGDVSSMTSNDKTSSDETEERALEVQQLQVKQGFVELFLYDVCKDYGSETYDVLSMERPNTKQPLKIRVRYNQTRQESSCIIESLSATTNSSKSSPDRWIELCDINSICYGTLRQNAVEINRSNGIPFRVEFKTSLAARSFLSLVDGYYRLMRKWNFNFCRDVSSPYLELLKKNRCHGPIGYETMRLKLPRQKKPGSFLVRKCMENNNRYMIDVLLLKARLTIDIDWDPEKKVFTKFDHPANTDNGITVLLNQQEYSNLKTLIDDLQIRLAEDDSSTPPLQLKNWIPPSEYDDCPALLLCMSKKKLKEFDTDQEKMVETLAEMPKLLRPGALQFTSKLPQRSNNKMFTRLAVLTGEHVVVKDHISNGFPHQSKLEHKDLVLNLSLRGFEGSKLLKSLHPVQMRLCDWLFIKNPMFADTIALEADNFALVQEYFPLGSLDRCLSNKRDFSESMKRSVFCQLALALLFLQERRIIHGKIRCHNIFIKNLNPIQVKITDMLGTLDADMDRAFLAPEYFRRNNKLYIQEYDSGIDVWAAGTTLWQIYSGGCKPPPWRYATTLIQPLDCPDEVWSIIETCWIIDPTNRASPQSLYRDANDLFVWERGMHNYDYISQAAGVPHNQQGPVFDDNQFLITEQVSCESRTSNSGSNGSDGSGSQMNLLSTKRGAMINNNMDFNRLTDAINLNHDKFPKPSDVRRKSSCRSWKNFTLFKNRSGIIDGGLNLDLDLEDKSGSKLSLSTCSTASDSEKTKSTMLMDSQGFTDDYGCNIDISKVRFGSEIGRGSSGIVMKGVLLEWGGFSEQVVAIKCVNTADLNNPSSIDDMKREAEILKSLRHENIVRLLGVIDEASVCLVLEYMPLGSLLSCIKNSHHDHLLSMPLKKYALDIASGMKYLESERIVHRDLALRNVLLKSQNEVKICDFGLAQHLGSSNHYKLKTDRALPLRWYAPEALKYWTFNHKTDVWSYGIVLWEIYSGGSNPQYSGTYADLSETLKHERLLKPRDCPEQMYNLMLSCWSYDPELRDSFVMIHERLETLPDFHSIGKYNFG